MGGRPIEAGSRKALPGVLGVRFSGDTGLNHQTFFGLLRAAGANTPHMKAYHVWSRGTACLASYKVGFVLLAILLCLDLAPLSKIGGFGSFSSLCSLFCSSVPVPPFVSRRPFAEKCDPHHIIHHNCARWENI